MAVKAEGGLRMSTKLRKIFLLTLFFLTPHWGLAQEREGLTLTLDQALKIALEKNKDIQKARQYRNLLEGRYLEERSAALPRLQLSGTFVHSRDESQKAYGFIAFQETESRGVGVELTQALYTFGQVGAAIRAAKIGLATAEDQLRLYRQAVIRDVTASFYDVLLAKELYILAMQNFEQKKRHLQEARRKQAAGVATDYDVLAAEVAVENARPEVIRKENLVRLSQDKLRFLLGLDDKEVEVSGDLEVSFSSLPTFDEIKQVALKNRAEISEIRKKIQIGNELIKIYDAGDKPRVDLKAAYGWRQLILNPNQGDGLAWSAGLYLTFPFFDGLRSRGKVMQAKSDLTTLLLEEGKLRDAITLQVREAWHACREAEEIVKALAETVNQAERLLFLAEKGYELGVKTKLDVDDAELNLTMAKTNLTKAKRDYLVALVTLEWVKGTLGEN